MKRFMFFVIGFVIALALVFNMGCVSVQKPREPHPILDGLEQELNESEKGPSQEEVTELGWIPMSETGYTWLYKARRANGSVEVVAMCRYDFMKVGGVEKWTGTYYQNPTDPPQSQLDNLSGCVAWVNHHMYGDYFI
jgi:hypothetical protein